MMTEMKYKTVPTQPIYEQIVKTLKSEIVKGTYKHGYKFPPEPELATIFNTSRPTLRKSLKLLEEQNLIVQRKGHGTFVVYQELQKRRIALVVGADIHNVHDSYYLQMVSALSIVLQTDSNHELMFLDTSGSSSILQKFHASGSDGLIWLTDSRHEREKLLKPEFKNIPMIFLNNRDKNLVEYGFSSVSANQQGIELAVEHLAKMGHQKIAYIATTNAVADLKFRNEAFLKIREKYGLDLDPRLYVDYQESELTWYDQARENTRKLCSGNNIPTAIICPNACNSYGSWQGIMDCHLRIPEDISIIGYDCDSMFNPYLGSIRQPVTEMAEAAGKLMISMLNKNRLMQKSLVFDIKLEERGSCAPPPKRRRR
jgi:DNA-binding LacI/PurR family transcriptional regulator